MRMLVMGGTGEVGHHVANGLARRGHDVTVLTRGKDSRRFELDARVRRVQADKNDAAALERAAVPVSPDVVVDTAGGECTCVIADAG